MTGTPFFAQTVGRRKKAIATLKLVSGSGKVKVNGKIAEEFFSGCPYRLNVIHKPFSVSAITSFDADVKVRGGGQQSQAKASQLALARALKIANPGVLHLFHKYSFLTRDSREKERRKYGLKKARKAPQFSKR